MSFLNDYRPTFVPFIHLIIHLCHFIIIIHWIIRLCHFTMIIHLCHFKIITHLGYFIEVIECIAEAKSHLQQAIDDHKELTVNSLIRDGGKQGVAPTTRGQ